MAQNRVPVRRALISVSDKNNLNMLATGLTELGVELLSTGGTAGLLKEAGFQVTEISDYTEFPEMMDGRLKTLHPRVHGALLGRTEVDGETMQEYGIEPIDLLVVNLYPFEQTINKPDVKLEEAIENIDIGGPAMIRAAAKNHDRVSVVVNPSDYEELIEELTTYGGISHANRHILAAKAYAHTARYDGLIANYLSAIHDTGDRVDFPRFYTEQYYHRSQLRYGENPHQKAAFYIQKDPPAGSMGTTSLLQGKALSYNNIADADAALECVKEFRENPACVIVKHANPCGVGCDANQTMSYLKAFETDPTSAFGGVLAFNTKVDKKTAETILDKQFAEVIVAPEYDEDALAVFAEKKNLRILLSQWWGMETVKPWHTFKRVNGGLLIQEADIAMVDVSEATIVTKRQPTAQELDDLQFAWKVVKWVKSNAIVYAKDQQTIGIGAGQMSRVVSARIAAMKAADEGLKVANSVMASDAFFPFRDGIDAAANAGITAVIQPGGSIRDEEVIQAADEHDMAMIFTGMRHFNH